LNTYKRKLVRERTHEVMKIRYINMGTVPRKISKGEIIGHVQGIENIIVAILYEHYKTSLSCCSMQHNIADAPLIAAVITDFKEMPHVWSVSLACAMNEF